MMGYDGKSEPVQWWPSVWSESNSSHQHRWRFDSVTDVPPDHLRCLDCSLPYGEWRKACWPTDAYERSVQPEELVELRLVPSSDVRFPAIVDVLVGGKFIGFVRPVMDGLFNLKCHNAVTADGWERYYNSVDDAAAALVELHRLRHPK